ncbi:MAG: tetratricopeptide repeat protein [Flavobacteriaceae bacterium]|nr:tetratricopeptide repeat protein [Flavobacteriaceae bacterium]
MATYKKRGYKKPKEKIDNTDELLNEDGYVEGESTTEEIFESLDTTANKAEDFVAKNQKIIYGIIAVIAIGVLGYTLWGKFITDPKQKDARNEMYQAETYFQNALDASGKAKDSLFNLALNGGEGKYGFLEIIENYGGSKAANLSKYYAGTAYLNLGQYDKAIDHLDQFDADQTMLGPIAKGAIGDAFVQLNQLDDALNYYEQAFKMNENEFTTPKYLQKAGVVALSKGDNGKALGYFQRIKDEFSASAEYQKVDVYIGRASVE